MHIAAMAKLPDGTEISYTDSGPLKDNPVYRTFVFIHGSAFNGRKWFSLKFLRTGSNAMNSRNF